MTRLPRCDFAGQWHHVMHRGIARRTVFESERDIRVFLAHIARAVHAGSLEVHAFCVLTTHFHLLVRSLDGALGLAMGHVLNEYVRWFNRGRRRDGALFRGRFTSRPVTTESYRRVLVRYIDFNPVRAGLVADPRLYPHGSASRLVAERGAPWLERGWIASVIADRTEAAELDANSYAKAFGRAPDAELLDLVERRCVTSVGEDDALDELLHAAPPQVLLWMQRKATLADGTSVGLPVCCIAGVRRAIDEARSERGAWSACGSTARSRPRDAWLQIENGLLRDLCGQTREESAKLLGRSTTWSSQAHGAHREALTTDNGYAAIVAVVASRALSLGHPGAA